VPLSANVVVLSCANSFLLWHPDSSIILQLFNLRVKKANFMLPQSAILPSPGFLRPSSSCRFGPSIRFFLSWKSCCSFILYCFSCQIITESNEQLVFLRKSWINNQFHLNSNFHYRADVPPLPSPVIRFSRSMTELSLYFDLFSLTMTNQGFCSSVLCHPCLST
jgi:hypothetical protein